MASLQDFWDRLRPVYNAPHGTNRQIVAPPPAPLSAPVQTPQLEPGGGDSIEIIMRKIRQAGLNKSESGQQHPLCLLMTYDGLSRFVEPYELKAGVNGLRFWGKCRLHGKIHQFKLDKIKDLSISNIEFTPEWEIKL